MVSYIRHEDALIPATVCLGERSTPVWIQTQWQQIASALYQGGTANEEMTWGEIERLWEGCTYVVAG